MVPLRGDLQEPRQLAEAMRNIANHGGIGVRDLEEATRYGRSTISQNLNGSQRPTWQFVERFLAACAADGHAGSGDSERKVLPLWRLQRRVDFIAYPRSYPRRPIR